MKRTFSFILILFITGTLLLNCNCKHVCTSSVPDLRFVNFDSASLNTVVVKQYNNNGQYNTLENTLVYTSTVFTSAHMPGADTFYFDTAGISVDFTSDYIIELPAAGKTWYLKGISMQPAKMSEPHCTNGLAYSLNDTMHTIPATASTAYNPIVIYLNK